jgi:hypothetical protein
MGHCWSVAACGHGMACHQAAATSVLFRPGQPSSKLCAPPILQGWNMYAHAPPCHICFKLERFGSRHPGGRIPWPPSDGSLISHHPTGPPIHRSHALTPRQRMALFTLHAASSSNRCTHTCTQADTQQHVATSKCMMNTTLLLATCNANCEIIGHF